MLPKKNRLAKTKDINLVYSRGRAFFSPYFTIKYLRDRLPEAGFRATVVVSTKVSKRATERNRIKRQIREVIRLHASELPKGQYLFSIKPKAARVENVVLRDACTQLLVQAHLIPPIA